jgi:hypothetical protein
MDVDVAEDASEAAGWCERVRASLYTKCFSAKSVKYTIPLHTETDTVLHGKYPVCCGAVCLAQKLVL